MCPPPPHTHTHRELGDSGTVFQCHADLGSLNLLDGKPALALRCLREALAVWTEELLWQQKAEVLREMAQVCMGRGLDRYVGRGLDRYVGRGLDDVPTVAV